MDLLLHLLHFILSWLELLLQLFDLVFQHKFELLQLIILLLKIVDAVFLQRKYQTSISLHCPINQS